MPEDIKECSLYSFTLRGQKVKTTPKDITARASAQAAQNAANGKQDALTVAQLAAVNSGITAEKVAEYDAFNVPPAFSGSPEMDGTASPGSANTWARGDHVHPHDTSKQDALTTAQQEAVNSGVTAAKVAAWDAIEVPTKTSDLTNDSGFVTLNVFGVPTSIPANADLNAYMTPGHFSAISNNTAASLSNSPTTKNFSLFVVYRTTSYINQIIISSDGAFYMRYRTASAWSSWYKFTGTAV